MLSQVLFKGCGSLNFIIYAIIKFRELRYENDMTDLLALFSYPKYVKGLPRGLLIQILRVFAVNSSSVVYLTSRIHGQNNLYRKCYLIKFVHEVMI